jgi:hypothetical protein
MLQDKYPTRYLPNVGRQVMQEGGVPTTDDPVVGSVEFAPEPALPTFAQPETQAVTKALDVANAAPPKEYKPFGVLPFREDESGIHFDPHAGVLGSVISGFTAPGDVVTGKLDPMSDEGIKRALDVAGLAMSGSAFGTRPAGALASGPSRPGIGHNMPPEEMKITPERVTNALGMYSHAADVARGLPQQKGTIEQMLGMIRPKVSPEEIHWSGIEKAFQPGQKVTAEDVAQHFEQNLPKLRETLYSQEAADAMPHAVPDNSSPHRMFAQDFSDYIEVNADGRAEMYGAESFENLDPGMQEQVRLELAEMFDDDMRDMYGDEMFAAAAESAGLSGVRIPKYKAYSSPGGTNYREITVALDDPVVQHANRHYNEGNILGHIRASDFKGPKGEKILNVHEVQSDWGQEARTRGVSGEGVNPAPYVTSREGSHNTPGWTDLLIKRVMQEAERGGYDKVVFDTVDEQVNRYHGLAGTKKGMPEFYGKILPNRIARVVKHVDPDFKMAEHNVKRMKYKPITWGEDEVKDALYEMDKLAFPDMEGVDPSLTYLGRYLAHRGNYKYPYPGEQLSKAGLWHDYLIHQGKKQGILPPRTSVSKVGDKFIVTNEELGKIIDIDDKFGKPITSFDTRKEALTAQKKYMADKVYNKAESGSRMIKRPGFSVTEAVKHVGKNTRAYKYGGDVKDALDIARKVGR